MLAARSSPAAGLRGRPAHQPRRSLVSTRASATATAARFVPVWQDCYKRLRAEGLRTIPADEAAELLATGKWVLLDVRRPDQHEQSHPEGALGVPMYRKIDLAKPDLQKVMKVIAYSFNGVQAIESNNEFTQEALAAAAGKKLIVMCEAGGTMRESVNFPAGKPSRSLQAAYKLIAEGGLGAGDVAHLERGVYGWYQAGLPIQGDYKPDIGRTPMAAADPTLANATGMAAYETQPGDKPVEAEKKKFFGLF